MHIGIHCFEYPPCNHGGIGSFSKDLAEGLVRRGYKVTVFGIYYRNVLDIQEPVFEVINGVNVYRYPQYTTFPNKRLNLVMSRLFLYRVIGQLHQKEPFDIIESPETEGWLPFGLPDKIALITRLHSGVTFLGHELQRPYSRLASWFEKQQLKHSTQIISVSDYVARRTFEHFKLVKDFITVYNSVSIHYEKPCEESDTYTIVYAGSISEKKGVGKLLEAMPLILESFPSARLILAGKCVENKNGISLIQYYMNSLDQRTKKHVSFLGVLEREEKLIPLICSATVCCFPSMVEAFSLAPIEAMALGKPVVYSKLHSGPEAINDGTDGLLCDPREAKDIADKIIALLKDKKLRHRLGEAARKKVVEKFSYQRWLSKNITIYQNVVKEHH